MQNFDTFSPKTKHSLSKTKIGIIDNAVTRIITEKEIDTIVSKIMSFFLELKTTPS